VKYGAQAYDIHVQSSRIILLTAALLILTAAGCQSAVKQPTAQVTKTGPPLALNSRVYIAMPEDGLDKKEPVPGSGRRVALSLQDAFKRHSRNILVGRITENLDQAIGRARDLEYEFVAMPTLLKWEDRPTEWTGVRDKLQLKIDVVSVRTREVLHSTTIDTKGKWMTDGEAAPQDLLAAPVDKFVRSLFRVTYTPSALQR
jgi:hypothetical protein